MLNAKIREIHELCAAAQQQPVRDFSFSLAFFAFTLTIFSISRLYTAQNGIFLLPFFMGAGAEFTTTYHEQAANFCTLRRFFAAALSNC
ncbi:MAG: hypothetical protein LBG47_03840 [Prevotellaceae bacterium]|jgi:hypothetical protein|nr:hypothetical protein [Prevotellaceae bacterium]